MASQQGLAELTGPASGPASAKPAPGTPTPATGTPGTAAGAATVPARAASILSGPDTAPATSAQAISGQTTSARATSARATSAQAASGQTTSAQATSGQAAPATGRLTGKRAAIIGAGSIGAGLGNGKATALRFAQEGARVLCVDRVPEAAEETARLIRAEGGQAQTFAADVTDPGSGRAVAQEMARLWGGCDILDYNVGINQADGALDFDEDGWDRVFDINLKGAMRMTKAILPGMVARRAGAIVYISSLAAVYSSPYRYTSYEVSKMALVRLARSVAREVADKGVRANVILPGVIETPHVNALVDSRTDPAELAAKRAAMVPMGRQGSAWDVANAALFLASDEAGYVSGVDLRVDGALTA